jgi:hypothetical protein
MLGRSLRLPRLVHVHFHDWELIDRRRALAVDALLRLLGLRRRAVDVAELARRAAPGAEISWQTATIGP